MMNSHVNKNMAKYAIDLATLYEGYIMAQLGFSLLKN